MCGICGFIDTESELNKPEVILKEMTDSILHRGPDASGHWFSADYKIGLGHRRLSIHDLSELGAQPMVSQCQRYIVIFNGEIYNYQDLKKKLVEQGYCFQGTSDTEVLLQLIVEVGFEQALKQCEGMFAIALYDTHKKTLNLARDRMGEKPLYVGQCGSHIVFGSELKVFKFYPHWQKKISTEALSCFFEYGYIPEPLSIFQNIRKVAPGSILTIDLLKNKSLETTNPTQYWSLERVVENSNDTKKVTNLKTATQKLDLLLQDVVQDQLDADVPAGIFLSGGIDSSAIVAIAQFCSKRKIKTFSIGFEKREFNEAPFAREVAEALGTDHQELTCTSEVAKAAIEKVVHYYDEPFSDASQLPMLVLCELTRKHVTVCLSGDGGDELFHGYSRYFRTTQRRNQLQSIPGFVIRLLKFISKTGRYGVFGDSLSHKLQSIGDRLSSFGYPWEFYRTFISRTGLSKRLVRNRTNVGFLFHKPNTDMTMDQLQRYCDTKQYLTSDILVKVDRASMASSLEVRVPLLNHKIVELAWSLSDQTLHDGHQGKLPLRSLLKKYLPDIDFDRPKKGFAVPLADWLRNDLKGWAFALLFNDPKLYEKYLEVEIIKKIWYLHQSKKNDFSVTLWDSIVFILWLKKEDLTCHNSPVTK